MRLNAPKVITFWVAVALAILGLILFLVSGAWAFWLLLIGFIILMLGNFIKGM